MYGTAPNLGKRLRVILVEEEKTYAVNMVDTHLARALIKFVEKSSKS